MANLSDGKNIKSVESDKYLTFNLGTEQYGLEILKVREIIGIMDITRVPRTPEFVRGVINLRGKVIPVLDLRNKFGMPMVEDTEQTCIIVVEVQVEDESMVVGALADAVREVLEVRTDQIEPPPRLGTRLNTEFITGMGKVDEQFMILLNIDRIFNSNELAVVQDAGQLNVPEQELETAEA